MTTTVRILAVTTLAALALSGCEGMDPSGGPSEETAAGATAAPPGRRAGGAATGDVEAPEVFSAAEPGLWDGRPSLGGIWVASPDATDPERVLIRNPATDRSVVGALFRRERDNPGPRLQVSSDAAAALGMLAGAPADLTVVALRRSDVAEPAPADTPATAEAAGTSPGASPSTAEAAPAAAAAEGAEPERRRPFWRRRDASAEAATGAAAATADGPAAAGPVGTSVLPTSASTVAPAGGTMIQVGTFSVKANADEAAARLAAAGVPGEVRRSSRGGTDSWRVVAGAASPEEGADMLTRIRGLGFTDAYVITP